MIFKDQAIQKLPPDLGSEPFQIFGCGNEKIIVKSGVEFENGCSDVTGDSCKVSKAWMH